MGIAPSSRGFGFAVVTKKNGLIDWGVKVVKTGNKNERCLSSVTHLLEIYGPHTIGLEDHSKNARRCGRIEELVYGIITLAEENGIRVKRLSRKQINSKLLRNERGTRHQIAKYLANAYKDQLSFRLPAKRRLWQSEAYQMDIFAAVALAQCSHK